MAQHPRDPQLLGSIFRFMHMIKGPCGFLGGPRLETVAHAAEDILGKIRDGELSVSQEAVSLVLAALDRIKELIDALARLGEEPKGSDEDIIDDLHLMASGKMPAAMQADEADVVEDDVTLDGPYKRLGGAEVGRAAGGE